MIAPMKKVTILCLDSDRQKSLETLRDMGILHVTPLKNPTGNGVNAAKNDLLRVQKALDSIPDAKKNAESRTSGSGESIVAEVQALLERRKAAEDRLSDAETAISRYGVFGNIDPESIRSLETRGVFARLYVAAHGSPLEAEGDALVFPFAENAEGKCYAVLNFGNEPAKTRTTATPLALPGHSLEFYRREESEAKADLKAVESRFSELSRERETVKERLREATDAYTFAETSAGMLSSNLLAAIQGFCPASRVEELSKAARSEGWGLRVEEPAEDDDVPTLLSYSKISRPMQFLYDVIGISPGYREVDVSSVFLCFFSIFFAMIVGDTAYGLLFLAITIAMRRKMPKANPSGFHFMYLMSGMTIFWGIVNASFLGLSPEMAHWSYYLDVTNYDWLPEPIRNAMLWIRTSAPADPAKFAAYREWLSGFSGFPTSFTPFEAGESQMEHIQLFCFCIAVVHLSIAHVWNIVVRLGRKDSTFMAQVGWLLCCWCMFALANHMVLGIDLPGFVVPMFITAAVLLVLFSVPPSRLKQEWISIPMLVLNIVNSFTDVISYIRLFAVGMSGAAIADAFNKMLAPMFGSAVGIAGAALILLFVHGLNIALAVMGVAVHAVRLNTLEFSNGLDLQWSGFAFAPFSKSKN